MARLFTSILRLSPFFLLHFSSGMFGGFTTLLLAHLGSLGYSQGSGYLILISTLEDYAQVLVSFLGGFLQQLLGPKNLLLGAALPGVLSWLLVAAGSTLLPCLLISRVLIGVSNSFLTGNVYMAETAPGKHIAPLKQIEAATRSLGTMVIYVIALVVLALDLDFWVVALVAGTFHLAGFVSAFFLPQSQLFLERIEDIKTAMTESAGGESAISCRINQAKKRLKVPLCSPEVYQPLRLIFVIICIQHFSGSVFASRFLLQVIEPNQSLASSPSNNSTAPDVQEEELDNTKYYYAMSIALLRFLANILMTKFVISCRIRFLYFFSLFTTSLCLGFMGILLHPTLTQDLLTAGQSKILRVVVLAIHVICTQFGIQNLAGQLTDTLLPSNSKAMIKGFIRGPQALSLALFIAVMNLLLPYQAFWTMAIVLLLSSPVLYITIPELRSLGREAGAFFFQPYQTFFYIVIPKPADSQAKVNWKKAGRLVKQASALLRNRQVGALESVSDSEPASMSDMTKHRAFDRQNSEDTQATFKENTIEDIDQKENKQNVIFIRNILGMTGFLAQNPSESRLLIARGPANFVDGLLKAGVFLFSDILIVAQRLRKNRKYVNEEVFHLQNETFKITRDYATLTFEDGDTTCRVIFKTHENAKMWEEYVNFCKSKAVLGSNRNHVEVN